MIAVFGLGISGKAVCGYLSRQQEPFCVIEENIDQEKRQFLEHLCPSDILDANRPLPTYISHLVVSPGIPVDHKLLLTAKAQGLKIESELEFGLKKLKAKCIIGITGTNGKSTAVSFLKHYLETTGEKAFAAGNIGTPVTSIIDDVDASVSVIVEVSSFQLEHIELTKSKKLFDRSMILNLSPDHLDRHKTFENYGAVKRNIFFLTASSNDCYCHISAAGAQKGDYRVFGDASNLLAIEDQINQDAFFDRHIAKSSVLAAALLLQLKPCRPTIVSLKKALKSFEPLKHRYNRIHHDNGVVWINDSKATNTGSTLHALSQTKRPCVLILGGITKNASLEQLRSPISEKCHTVIVYGMDRELIASQLSNCDPVIVESLKEAIKAALSAANKGDCVLFSPACSSFDQFKNFEHRGDSFTKWVKEMTSDSTKSVSV